MGPRSKNAGSELLPGPFLKHELRSLLRSRRAFWLLVLAVAASGSFALLSWPRADQAAEASLESRGTFFAFALAQLTLTIFMIPAFTAGAFAGEREHGTYDLLYSTPASPVSILVSKVLASTGYVGIVLTASAPAVCVLYLLGGIAFGVILKGYAVTFAAVLFQASLAFSSLKNR